MTLRLLGACIFFAIPAFVQAAQRVFVASYGNDLNTCTLAAPCRGFTRALTQVDSGGEIVALDAAGYGSVAIDKSVTITSNPGFFAGIAATSGIAVSVVGFNAKVVLRGLNLNGVGADVGIQMHVPGSLTVENCVVANFGNYGIMINHDVEVSIVDTTVRGNGYAVAGGAISVSTALSASLHNVRMSNNNGSGLSVFAGNMTLPTHVVVTDSESSNNTSAGYWAAGAMGGPAARLSIRGSSSHNNGYGVLAFGPTAVVAISQSSITYNLEPGLDQGGVIETYGDNVIRYNFQPFTATAVLVSGQ